MAQPTSIGNLLKQYFIIRPDGSVDHDMVVALARAAEMHQDPFLSPLKGDDSLPLREG